MDHLRAINILPRYVADELAPGQRAELEEHLERCPDCSGWVATYSLFSGALGTHPTSLELVDFVLSPEAQDPTTRKRLASHLERCRECRLETELVARSGLEPAELEPRSHDRTTGRGRVRTAVLGAAAAVAAMALVVLGVVVVSRMEPRLATDQLLADSTLRGDETIRADQSLVVEATRLAPGANITLRSEMVALGNGFTVESGATLEIDVSRSELQ